MSFGIYADQYAAYVRSNPDLLTKAAALMLLELSRGQLHVLYCVDPYVRDYAKPDEILRVPYGQRTWFAGLRTVGCHRVVLAEELAHCFLDLGLDVTIFEIDQTLCRVVPRHFSCLDHAAPKAPATSCETRNP